MRSEKEFREASLEARLSGASEALCLDRHQMKKLILKEFTRIRFFLQEAVDALTPEEQLKAGLTGTNILLELTWDNFIPLFEERTIVNDTLEYYCRLKTSADSPTVLRALEFYEEQRISISRLRGLFSAFFIQKFEFRDTNFPLEEESNP